MYSCRSTKGRAVGTVIALEWSGSTGKLGGTAGTCVDVPSLWGRDFFCPRADVLAKWIQTVDRLKRMCGS